MTKRSGKHCNKEKKFEESEKDRSLKNLLEGNTKERKGKCEGVCRGERRRKKREEEQKGVKGGAKGGSRRKKKEVGNTKKCGE